MVDTHSTQQSDTSHTVLSPGVNTDSPCVVLDGNIYDDAIILHEDRFQDRPRVINTMALMALAFFLICGGPAGSEQIISSSGPAIGLPAIVIFAFVYAIPMNVMVTEMVTAIPEGGSYAYWVALAFGPFWGLQAGYWSWVTTCIDCAIYAGMAVTSVTGPRSSLSNTFVEFVLKATLAIVLALPAFFSIRNVGSLAALLFLFAMIPYVSICIWGAFVAEHWEQLVEFRHANVTVNGEWTTSDSHSPISIDWPVLVRSLLWNFSGFLDVSVFVTDVANPIVAYRRVMLICILLIPVMYMFPLGVGSAVNHPQWSTWEEGSLGDVARSFGGDAMSGWIRATGFLCAVGLFICTLLSSSFLASGMAESGLAPRSLARRSAAHNTPQSAVFCTLAVVLVIVCLEFEDMVVLCNALNAFTGIIVIMAAVRLRGTIRNIDRPTRLCRGMPSTFFVLALLIPLAIYVFVAIDAFRNAIGGTLSGVFILAGIIYGKQTDFSDFQKDM